MTGSIRAIAIGKMLLALLADEILVGSVYGRGSLKIIEDCAGRRFPKIVEDRTGSGVPNIIENRAWCSLVELIPDRFRIGWGRQQAESCNRADHCQAGI